MVLMKWTTISQNLNNSYYSYQMKFQFWFLPNPSLLQCLISHQNIFRRIQWLINMNMKLMKIKLIQIFAPFVRLELVVFGKVQLISPSPTPFPSFSPTTKLQSKAQSSHTKKTDHSTESKCTEGITQPKPFFDPAAQHDITAIVPNSNDEVRCSQTRWIGSQIEFLSHGQWRFLTDRTKSNFWCFRAKR